MNWLIGTSPEANALRQATEFYIYPCADPEGRYSGYYVSSPVNPNANHNRIWFDSNGLNWDPNGNPEVKTIEAAERLDTGGPCEVFLRHARRLERLHAVRARQPVLLSVLPGAESARSQLHRDLLCAG